MKNMLKSTVGVFAFFGAMLSAEGDRQRILNERLKVLRSARAKTVRLPGTPAPVNQKLADIVRAQAGFTTRELEEIRRGWRMDHSKTRKPWAQHLRLVRLERAS